MNPGRMVVVVGLLVVVVNLLTLAAACVVPAWRPVVRQIAGWAWHAAKPELQVVGTAFLVVWQYLARQWGLSWAGFKEDWDNNWPTLVPLLVFSPLWVSSLGLFFYMAITIGPLAAGFLTLGLWGLPGQPFIFAWIAMYHWLWSKKRAQDSLLVPAPEQVQKEPEVDVNSWRVVPSHQNDIPPNA